MGLVVLDERKAAILKAIVQGYVRDGEPVGSKRLAEDWNLGVSAATIRADMAALEEAELIAQPHTSAGRVPTDKGYRYFVDSLSETAQLSVEQRAALEGLLLGSSDLEELLRRTSSVLSRLTRFAAVVAAPRLDRTRLRHIELVTLGPNSVLAVMIADTGQVEKRMLDLGEALMDHDVQRARHALNEAAAGLRVTDAPDVIAGVAAGAPHGVRELLESVADAVRGGLVSPPGAQIFVGGSANIADAGYFERLEQVREVYETLEQQVLVLGLLRAALEAGDPAVRIGEELRPLAELAACSIVVASYGAGADSVGSLGVLGPTRMDYPRTLAAVQAVASGLEKALAELTGS
ncbi:MAG TPA: heat-inducible transcriptional repressor HrcA [Egibacteraceae bacterium]|nr:heat-inducible transcriptional repressor HrcA [Egibacteraceae bacterium]